MSFNTGSIYPPGPLAYEGTVAPSLISRTFNPLPKFNTFEIGTIWINTAASLAFILVSKALGVAVWLPLGGLTSAVETITTPDANVVVPVSGNVNFAQSGSISITGTGDTVSFNVVGSGFVYTEVTTSPFTLVPNQGYIINTPGLCTLQLPASISEGAVIPIVGKGSGGWRISYGTGQYIVNGKSTSTITTGSVYSSYYRDCIDLICTISNIELQIKDSQGNIGYT